MGNQKRISFARIKIDKSQQESFELIKKILDELDLQKWKEKTTDEQKDRKSTRQNSSHSQQSRMPSSA